MDHEEQPTEDQMVYWHHFTETEEMAREAEAAFPNVVFGVAPAILKEQLDDQLEKFIRSTSPERLMAENDAPIWWGSVALQIIRGQQGPF